MGSARRRGTYEDRKTAAIAAGRVKQDKPSLGGGQMSQMDLAVLLSALRKGKSPRDRAAILRALTPKKPTMPMTAGMLITACLRSLSAKHPGVICPSLVREAFMGALDAVGWRDDDRLQIKLENGAWRLFKNDIIISEYASSVEMAKDLT